MKIETPKTEKRRNKKDWKKRKRENRILKNCGATTKVVILWAMGIPEGKTMKERNRSNIWEFSQINVRHQTIDPGSSENTTQGKCINNLHLSISYSNLRKSKIKNKILKEARGKKNQLIYRGIDKHKNYIQLFLRPLKQEESGVKYLKFKTWISVSCKIILQKWKRNKDLVRQTKIKGFFANRLALQEMLKEILWREGKWHRSET